MNLPSTWVALDDGFTMNNRGDVFNEEETYHYVNFLAWLNDPVPYHDINVLRSVHYVSARVHRFNVFGGASPVRQTWHLP